ncbi:hypothetical protein [Pseudodesulfovibrio sp.]|uniref:hypothetical protein n=1 Tax=unclassified Pseudodesulfovibrio TaxID=2661612 RepID=UPI003B0082E6
MNNNLRLQLVFFLTLSLCPLGQALAGEPAPFPVGCEDVKHVIVALINKPGESERLVVGCQVELTSAAGHRLDAHCAKWFGDMFPVTANGTQITLFDSTTRSIPPKLCFVEESWKKAKIKLMAICPDKIPEVPQSVLDHRPEQ